jgi:hypothetical protein
LLINSRFFTAIGLHIFFFAGCKNQEEQAPQGQQLEFFHDQRFNDGRKINQTRMQLGNQSLFLKPDDGYELEFFCGGGNYEKETGI